MPPQYSILQKLHAAVQSRGHTKKMQKASPKQGVLTHFGRRASTFCHLSLRIAAPSPPPICFSEPFFRLGITDRRGGLRLHLRFWRTC